MVDSYIQVYTGNGKGKTTAAIGQLIRASGHDWKAKVIQLMKGPPFPRYGEQELLEEIDGIDLSQFPVKHLIDEDDIRPRDREIINSAIDEFRDTVTQGEKDMVVMDEINTACHFGLATPQDIIDIIDMGKPDLVVVLTGRYAPELFIDQADLVTEMKKVKHPFDNGVEAREGVEW